MNGMPKMLMLVKPFGTDQPGRRSNCLMLGGPPNGAIVAVPTALCPLPSVRVEWAGLCARGFLTEGQCLWLMTVSALCKPLPLPLLLLMHAMRQCFRVYRPMIARQLLHGTWPSVCFNLAQKQGLS